MSTDGRQTIITAIIKPHLEGRVVRALHDLTPFPGLTIVGVRGQGRGRGAGSTYTATEYDFAYLRHLQVQLVCPSESAPAICEVIARAAWTGQKGDGVIFTADVTSFGRIREMGRPEHEPLAEIR